MSRCAPGARATAFEVCCGGRLGPPPGDGGSCGNGTGHVDASGNVAAYSFAHFDYEAWGDPKVVAQPGGHESLYGVDQYDVVLM